MTKLPTQRQQTLLIACIIFLAAFLLLTFFRPSLHGLDVRVNLWMPSIQSRSFTPLAEGIAFVFDTTSLVVISVVISGILLIKNRKPYALLLLGGMGGDALLLEVTKTIVHSARPTNMLVPDTGFSYPSGHSAGIVVFGGILAYFAFRHWQSTRTRVSIGVGLGVVVAVVSFDRLYLNVHWLSDVLGSWLFGTFWLLFVILVFGWLERAGKFGSDRFNVVANWLYVAAVVVAVLVVASGLFT